MGTVVGPEALLAVNKSNREKDKVSIRGAWAMHSADVGLSVCEGPVNFGRSRDVIDHEHRDGALSWYQSET